MGKNLGHCDLVGFEQIWECRTEFLGLPGLQKCVKFDLEFDLKFEFRWEKSGEILGEDFSTCQESTKKFRANFGANSEKNSEKISFQISRLFSETSFSRRAVLIDFPSVLGKNKGRA